LDAPKLKFALDLWGTGSSFGETFGGEWKTFRGSSIPENMGRIG